MNPIKKYLQNFFVKQRIIGEDFALSGVSKADALLADLVNDKRVPGLSVTVLKDGKKILQKGYGHADLEKRTRIDPSKSIFRIASVSKPIAATALATMVEDGLIDLDASFYTYVPYFPKKKWDFTIRQLASHTAGIRGYKGVEYGLNYPYTIKEGIDIFKDDKLIFQPGKDYFYNSFDWVLVSLAMQEVSGIPFEKYVREKVLKPLAMKNTRAPSLTGTNSDMDNRATFYSKNRSGFAQAIPVNNYYKIAGGGYLSTSEDIAKLGQAYIEGTILRENNRLQFLRSQMVNGESTYYGLGWQVSEDAKGRPFFGHIGNGVGGYSNFFIYPEERMVIAILVNCTDPKIQLELDTVVDALLEAIL